MSSRVYLDSCVVIYLLEGQPELSRTVWTNDHRLSAAAKDRLELKVVP